MKNWAKIKFSRFNEKKLNYFFFGINDEIFSLKLANANKKKTFENATVKKKLFYSVNFLILSSLSTVISRV